MKNLNSWYEDFRLLIISALLAFFFLQTGMVYAKEKLIIGTSYKFLLSTPAQDGMLDEIAIEAFQRIGIQIELPYLPTERSINAANEGIHDGELNRVEDLENIYPNLIRTDESMMDFYFVGFTKHASVDGGSWNNLKPFQIGIIKGWKILEANVGKFPHVTCFYSAEELFNGLSLDRIDIALYGKLIGLAVISEMGLKDIKMITPPFASKKMYLYLHKKHQALIPEISNSLRQMKQDGFYDSIVSGTMCKYREMTDSGFK
ncbi:MAG: transporter substrate-binding domain-containing protein [Desulfamplus sp.]|nr:transporter substrate-binding domain-containing protein [Desulfamplus sp.]